jgi:L-asparaginase II
MVESRHRGSLIVLAADGSLEVAAGAADQPIFPRSANKPMQACAMLRCGLDLPPNLLALAAASHSGEEFHIEGVKEILARASLREADLQCPPDLPLDEAARIAWLRAGGSADRIHMNCSGKHAAMLATCVAAGWPATTYRDPGHPLQQEIRIMLEHLATETVAVTATDGCGAPLFATSPVGLARAFRSLVLSPPGSEPRRVADAMRAHPVWTSGTARPEAAMAGAVPGLLIKSGADGVCAFALPDGRAAAVKFEDGAQRGVPPLMASLLLGMAVGGQVPGTDEAALKSLVATPVLGGGVPVGEIRAVLPA